jgi:hypothetical protein
MAFVLALTACLAQLRLFTMHTHSRFLLYGLLLSLACTVLSGQLGRAESATVAATDPLSLFNDQLMDGSQPTPLAIVPTAPSEKSTRSSPSGYPSSAVSLFSIGPRFGVGGSSPLGEEQKENFHLYDIAALWRLPWSWEYGPSSFWRVESRLIGSAGQLTAAGTSSFMSTIVPTVALATRGGALALDIGTGLAFFTNYKFGVQDFGGPVQIIATTGLSIAPVPGFRAGYRFQHFSTPAPTGRRA